MKGSHIVVDIETLCTKSDATIISIGAVHMVDDDIHDESLFYVDISDKQQEYGRTLCPKVVGWWKRPENQEALMAWRNSRDKKELAYAMNSFGNWVQKNCRADTLFWSKGTVFDFPLLWSAARASGMSDYFIPYWDVMCIRPLMKAYELKTGDEKCLNLEEQIIEQIFEGDFVKHTADCDAVLEAHILHAVADYLGLYQ